MADSAEHAYRLLQIHSIDAVLYACLGSGNLEIKVDRAVDQDASATEHASQWAKTFVNEWLRLIWWKCVVQ